MTDDDRAGAVIRRIAPVARQLRQASDDALSELGIGSSAGWCLVRLSRGEGGGRQSDLAGQLGITQPSLARTIDRLQQAGLVGRERHPDDKRSNRLALTQKGRDMVSRIEQRLTDLHHDLLKDVPDGAIDIMANLLDLMSQRLAARRVGT